MTDLANTLLNHRPDAFAAIRDLALSEAEKHARTSDVGSHQQIREITAMIASARASYVLLVNSGFGYLPLHLASTFGQTGQVDIVEQDPAVAAFVEQLARQLAVGDRVRVHVGTPGTVISSLNGPYDAVVLLTAQVDATFRVEDAVRLTRTGGMILITNAGDSGDVGAAVLEALATDARLLTSFPPDLAPVLAVRRR